LVRTIKEAYVDDEDFGKLHSALQKKQKVPDPEIASILEHYERHDGLLYLVESVRTRPEEDQGSYPSRLPRCSVRRARWL